MNEENEVTRGTETAASYPRRGVHWEVFNPDEPSIERCDDPPGDFTDEENAAWDDDPFYPEGLRFSYDEDAAGFVLTTASRPPEDAPAEVVAECRAAVREIVASWGRA